MMQRKVWALAGGVALTAATLVSGSPAAAHHGGEGCPPPFEALDLQDQLALAAEKGVPASEVYAVIDMIDKNGDTVLCFMFLPDGFPNIIDNRTAH